MMTTQTISLEKHTHFHTKHSIIRSKQRGINNESISFILHNTTPIFKQGFRFYSLKNGFSAKIPKQFKEEGLMNMIVMTSEDTAAIITVYKDHHAWKKIKQKNKYLS